jgi:hypothetical protein
VGALYMKLGCGDLGTLYRKLRCGGVGGVGDGEASACSADGAISMGVVADVDEQRAAASPGLRRRTFSIEDYFLFLLFVLLKI